MDGLLVLVIQKFIISLLPLIIQKSSHNIIFLHLSLDPKLIIWQMPYPGTVMGLGVGLTGGKGVPCVNGSAGATATFCNEEEGN